MRSGVLARFLDRSRTRVYFVSDAELREFLAQGQSQIQRGLREAYVIDGSGRNSGAWAIAPTCLITKIPTSTKMALAAEDGMTIIQPTGTNNEFRALVRLESYLSTGSFMSAARWMVQSLDLLDDTKETVHLLSAAGKRTGQGPVRVRPALLGLCRDPDSGRDLSLGACGSPNACHARLDG